MQDLHALVLMTKNVVRGQFCISTVGREKELMMAKLLLQAKIQLLVLSILNLPVQRQGYAISKRYGIDDITILVFMAQVY